MINFIQSIPGPQFLLLFLLLSVFLITAGKIFLENDGTKNIKPFEPQRLHPVEIAFLKGDMNHVINTVIFSLIHQGIITVDSKKNSIKVLKPHKDSLKLINRFYSYLSEKERIIKNIFSDEKLKQLLSEDTAEIREKLQSLNILRNKEQLKRVSSITNLFTMILILSGGVKLYLGIVNSKPSVFLIILLVFALCMQRFIFRHKSELTNCGKRFIKELDKQLSFMGSVTEKDIEENSFDPTYGVALFGITSLAALPAYSFYTSQIPDFVINNTSTSNFGGGCSGCSSCSGCGGGCSGCGGCGG